MTTLRYRALVTVLGISLALLAPRLALAHCDTVSGPVVTAAKLALKTGDVTPILKWVKPQDEPQIRAAFARALEVRTLSPEARELADTFFFETVVRLHRAGEGEPFTGLKPEGTGVEPGIALADEALDGGSADGLIKQVTAEVAEGISRRMVEVQEARKHADDSVEAGRRYVAAYVEFIHYVENMHQVGTRPVGHSHGNAVADAEEHPPK